MQLSNRIFKLIYYSVVRFMGLHLIADLTQLNQTQFYSSEKLHSLQNEKLNAILQHTSESVPYYAKAMQGKKGSHASLNDFPFVTKKDILDNPSSFLSSKTHGKLIKKTTGGSTGETLTVCKDNQSFSSAMAATWRGYSWAGVGIGNKQARFWGIPITFSGRIKMRLTDFLAHRKRFSAFAFTDSDLANYTKQLLGFNPDYFYGYVSMLNQYADYLNKHKKNYSAQLKAIITTSEVLTSDVREKLQNIFGVRVYNEYGCGEFGTIAHECEEGKLHINDERLIVEIYDGDRKCNPGEIGEIVVTELNNYAMPLIKYRMGDFASLDDSPCSCGRGLSIIGSLYGRAYDMVRNRDGRLFHGEFFMYIFELAKRKKLGISSFQVIQTDIDKLKIKVVPDSNFSDKSEWFIKSYFQKNFSKSVSVEFEKVSEIKRTPSGKMRLIVGMDAAMNRTRHQRS